MRLVDLPGSGLFLTVSERDNNQAEYNLIQSLEHGIFAIHDLKIRIDRHFGSQTEVYLSEVATSHGVSLDLTTNQKVIIKDPARGTAIFELFRDPAFLSFLGVEPMAYLLSIKGELAATGDRDFDEGIHLYAQGDGPAFTIRGYPRLATEDLARPEGLAGAYLYDETDKVYDLDMMALEKGVVNVRPLPDGRFEMDGLAGQLSLLPFDAQSDTYVAIRVGVDEWDKDEGEPRNVVWLVSREEKTACWSFDEIRRQPAVMIATLDNARAQFMSEAAQKYGINYENGVISGDLEGNRLIALFTDGRFTTGLETETDFKVCPTKD